MEDKTSCANSLMLGPEDADAQGLLLVDWSGVIPGCAQETIGSSES